MVETISPQQRVQEMIRQQGIKPVEHPEELLGGWPGEPKTAEEVMATIRELRRE